MPSEEEIYEWCAAMYLAVDESYEQVYLVHSYLVRDPEVYLAVWERLEAPFRAFWKGCLDDRRRSLGEGCGVLEGYRRALWEAPGSSGVLRGESEKSEVHGTP
jgi:hypothetical protein